MILKTDLENRPGKPAWKTGLENRLGKPTWKTDLEKGTWKEKGPGK
jgi:hypothetical protein